MEYQICQVYNSLDSEFNMDRLKPVQTGTPTYRPTGVPVRLNTLFQKIQYFMSHSHLNLYFNLLELFFRSQTEENLFAALGVSEVVDRNYDVSDTVTPPTMLVPYSIISSLWNDPIRPVKPCTRTGVPLSITMLMHSPPDVLPRLIFQPLRPACQR